MSVKKDSGRIKLVNCDLEILNVILQGNEKLASHLDVRVPANWSQHGSEAFTYSLEKIKQNPETEKWWAYLPIHNYHNAIIGSCGFKGAPDKDGMVELGYEVIESYRNKGYAREITNMLVTIAFEDAAVKKVWAHTLANENPSVSLLRNCNFIKIEDIEDEEDGKMWRWEKIRSTDQISKD